MSVTAIVSEYNPFHNGHKYNIEMAKLKTKSEYIISIMSGSFLQRGEPALFDKWSRAKMAVLNGADLVIELPVIFSCQPAQNFAYGAIKTLDSLKLVNYLCFGSESGEINDLIKVSKILLEEPKTLKKSINQKLSLGISYPKALGDSINNYYTDILYPNNILGIEYIKSLIIQKSSIKPITIKRIKNQYNDTFFTGSISSATAIRNEIESKGLSNNFLTSLPKNSLQIIKENIGKEKGPIFLSDFFDLIIYQLRRTSLSELSRLPYIKEGLEYRIKKKSVDASDLIDLIDAIKTKRYTKTHIQRMLIHALLGITAEDVAFSKKTSQVYIRILAFNNQGRKLIKEIKKSSSIPLITKPSNFESKNRFLNRIFDLDIISTDIYNLAMKNPKYRIAKQDYTNSPIYIDTTTNTNKA